MNSTNPTDKNRPAHIDLSPPLRRGGNLSPTVDNGPAADGLRAAVRAVLPATRADLEALVRIPSVSADPAHAGDVRQALEYVERLAQDAGASTAEIFSAGGLPALIARWPAPERMPTVLLYAHADVQPTGPEREWTSPPFEPTERDGRLYGRGAADAKAGVLMHLAVLRAFRGRPPVGVMLFVEGEEEVGSPTLTRLLADRQEAVRPDVIVIADSTNAAADVPAFTTSLRGLVDAYVEVRLLDRPVHSGMFAGPVVDALTVLCRLLGTLHDSAGNVAVEGLRSGASDAPDVDEAVFRADVGLSDGAELVGRGSIVDRLWNKPAVSVLGIDAPATSEASNVLLPRARAKVSLRVAPGDDAATAIKALRRHLESHAEWGAEVTVTDGVAGEPVRLGSAGRVYELARRTFAEAYGNEPVETGIGASIAFIGELARTYPGATVLVTGVGDPASRWHGVDESLDLAMWERACLAEALLLQGLAGS